MLAIVNDAGRAVVEQGTFRLTVGGVSPGTRGKALGAPEPAQTTLTVQ
jgi:hypothetical protein